MSFPFTPNEAFIVSRINGIWDVRSIARISPFPEAEVMRVFHKLHDERRRLVQVSDGSRTSGPSCVASRRRWTPRGRSSSSRASSRRPAPAPPSWRARTASSRRSASSPSIVSSVAPGRGDLRAALRHAPAPGARRSALWRPSRTRRTPTGRRSCRFGGDVTLERRAVPRLARRPEATSSRRSSPSRPRRASRAGPTATSS